MSFPLNSNQAYIKETGERSTLGAMLSGGGSSELPDYSESDAGKFLGVDSSGDLEWAKASEGTGTTALAALTLSDYPYTATKKGYVLIWARGSDTESSQSHYYFTIKLNNTTIAGGSKDFNKKSAFYTIPVNVGDQIAFDGNPSSLSEFTSYMLTQ